MIYERHQNLYSSAISASELATMFKLQIKLTLPLSHFQSPNQVLSSYYTLRSNLNMVQFAMQEIIWTKIFTLFVMQ